MDVGFIGIGSMGAAMVPNLVKAGHRVGVWNRNAAAAHALQGVAVLASPLIGTVAAVGGAAFWRDPRQLRWALLGLGVLFVLVFLFSSVGSVSGHVGPVTVHRT